MLKDEVPCPTCGNEAVFVDHGHTVGKGYFCRICIADVAHPSNTWGLTGTQIQLNKTVKKPDPTNRFGAAAVAGKRKGDPTTILKPNQSYTVAFLDCKKKGCLGCNGRLNGMPTINLYPGDDVLCVAGGSYILNNRLYEVAQVLAETIRVWVYDSRGQRVHREYTRCRFQKVNKFP